jgi:hypothetical protein
MNNPNRKYKDNPKYREYLRYCRDCKKVGITPQSYQMYKQLIVN